MIVEVCLIIIAAALVISAIVLIIMLLQVKRSVRLVQTDLHHMIVETTRLASSLNRFVEIDLATVSQETTQLISELRNFCSDINNKSHSLNFLFKPLSFLSNKFGSDLSSDESPTKEGALPQILKWIVSSAILFKTTKEFMKHGK
ncbi:MAG TPA: DUF948 domain-containing protein [Rhabdochlamydiaceae bacterium]